MSQRWPLTCLPPFQAARCSLPCLLWRGRAARLCTLIHTHTHTYPIYANAFTKAHNTQCTHKLHNTKRAHEISHTHTQALSNTRALTTAFSGRRWQGIWAHMTSPTLARSNWLQHHLNDRLRQPALLPNAFTALQFTPDITALTLQVHYNRYYTDTQYVVHTGITQLYHLANWNTDLNTVHLQNPYLFWRININSLFYFIFYLKFI